MIDGKGLEGVLTVYHSNSLSLLKPFPSVTVTVLLYCITVLLHSCHLVIEAAAITAVAITFHPYN